MTKKVSIRKWMSYSEALELAKGPFETMFDPRTVVLQRGKDGRYSLLAQREEYVTGSATPIRELKTGKLPEIIQSLSYLEPSLAVITRDVAAPRNTWTAYIR